MTTTLRTTRTTADVAWSVAVSVTVVLLGMAYAFWWGAVVQHHPWYWVIPGDSWGTVRGAHWIEWGSFSYIYSSRTALVTLPGFNLLLAPVVTLSSHLHLTETAPGLPGIPKPSAWFLIGPAFLACAALPVFAADALARRMDLSRATRRVLSIEVAAAVFPAIALWGHPEDVLALGFAMYATSAMVGGRLGVAGWLLGAALSMQLYVVALVPLFLFVVGRRQAPALLARAAVLPGFLLVAVLVPNPHATLHALLDQPNYPTVDHPTPWILLAPKLGPKVVAAGPGRIVGFLLAVGVGALGLRWRRDPRRIVWLAAVALGLRCLTESVMVPYYVMPVVTLAVVSIMMVAPLRRMRLAGIAAAGAGLTVLTFYHHGMWLYWSEMAAVTAAMLALAWPAAIRGWPSPTSKVDPTRGTRDDAESDAEEVPPGVASVPLGSLRA